MDTEDNRTPVHWWLGRAYIVGDGGIALLTIHTREDLEDYNRRYAEATSAEEREAVIRSIIEKVHPL